MNDTVLQKSTINIKLTQDLQERVKDTGVVTTGVVAFACNPDPWGTFPFLRLSIYFMYVSTL